MRAGMIHHIHRWLCLMVMIFTGIAMAYAQKGLAVKALFDGRYRKDPTVVETTLRGTILDNYDIDLYRSISFASADTDVDAIESCIRHDARLAVDSEVSKRGDRIYYAFYRLRGGHNNRYLLYLNQRLAGGDKIIVLYIEGEASPKDIKKMFNHK